MEKVKKLSLKMERIELFFNDLYEHCTNREIAAGLTNGDITVPEWMAISEDTDHLKAWDQEAGDSAQSGFMTIWY